MSRWLLFSILLTTLAIASVAVVWVNREAWLPNEVPTHWGIQGKPDAWMARDSVLPYLLIAPGMMVLMLLMTVALPWLSPRSFSIEPFRPTYEYIMAVVVLLFAYLHVVILIAQMSETFDLVRWMVSGMLLILAALGASLGKVKRNFYVGVKTPWTLASDTVWDRTHHLAAWLMTGGALLGAALTSLGVSPLIAMGFFFVGTITPVFYSLWLYKHLEKTGQLDRADLPAR